jgi:hypothetical protein
VDATGRAGKCSFFLFFLNLKDFCRCLTDFSQLYLFYWAFPKALHRPDDWANGGGGGANHSFPRRGAVHFDFLFLSAAVLLFLSNCLRHGIGSFHPRYDVFLILKDLCRFLTDFSQLYRLHWAFRKKKITQVDTALDALFKMPFAEEWQNLDTPKARWLTSIYWILFLILSVLLLNLLIAIVTQVYPSKLALSEDVWKATITDMMQLNLRNQSNKRGAKGNRKGKRHR